jgi:putative salt-induced outer membrane protein YdiY
MTPLSVLVASLLVAQAQAQPPPAAAPDAATRAAAAAEKAAQAAQVAAEAALKAAEAAQKLSAVVPARFEVPAAPAAAPAPTPAKSSWSGTVGLGLMSLTGNSRSITFTTNAAAEWKNEGWIAGGKLLAAYGENTPASGAATEKVAEMAALQLRGDRRFGDRYTGYVLGAIATDHVKSIEARSSGELGASLVWVDAKGSAGWETKLRTDLGFRISEERRYQYYPTPSVLDPPAVMLYAPRAAVSFAYAVSKDLLFTEDADVMVNVSGESRVLANSLTKISVRLTRTLAFGVGFTVNHDSVPAAGKVPTDTQLAMTLDVLL